jgi:hypothetical protein
MFGMARLCGTFGCTLPDMHKGLHEVKTTHLRKCRTIAKRTAEEVVDICHVDGEVVAASNTPIQSMIGLYIIHKDIKVLWDGSELVDDRSRWFKGTVVAFKPKTRTFLVHYRDGDKRWERIIDKNGLLLPRCKVV